ncbi:MAG: UTP--glucose-1-phosphate uridylyltransferase GalU [Clostridia bacterium]|nr:UTP--glucose-1-phosphate uridylyltransferase GalU [Clostridia bacterium]
MVKKAVIPAAGFGTRMLPASKTVPKEMLTLVDRPSISYVVEEAISSGVEDILIITSRGKTAMEEYFVPHFELEAKLSASKKFDELKKLKELTELGNIHFVYQKEQKGLGHAIRCAKAFTGDEPFAVILADDIVYNDGAPATRQLIDAYEKLHGVILGVQYIDDKNISKYGVIKPQTIENGLFRVTDMAEKPKVEEKMSNYAALGHYILTPEIYDAIDATVPGVGGEIQLTDAIRKLIDKNLVYAVDFAGKRYDAGNRLGYMKASVEYALRSPEIGKDFKAYLTQLVKGI